MNIGSTESASEMSVHSKPNLPSILFHITLSVICGAYILRKTLNECVWNPFSTFLWGFLCFNGLCKKEVWASFFFLHLLWSLILFVEISFSVLLVAIDGGFLEPYILCSWFVFITTSWNTDPEEWAILPLLLNPTSYLVTIVFCHYFFSPLHLYLRHLGGVFRRFRLYSLLLSFPSICVVIHTHY